MQVICTRTSAYLKHIKTVISWGFSLMELWYPMFFTVNCKFLKEVYCIWIKPPRTSWYAECCLCCCVLMALAGATEFCCYGQCVNLNHGQAM